MRRTKNLSKRVATAVLAASMLMTGVSVSMAVPTVAYAEDVTQGQTVDVNSSAIEENHGTITTNAGQGSVDENYGTITNNYGSVNVNEVAQSEGVRDGYVTNNLGTVTTNNGLVVQNRHSSSSPQEGKIITNNGRVITNSSGDRNNSDNGYGIRTNNGIVQTNYRGGYIDVNHGAVHDNKGLINSNDGNDPTTTITNSYIAKGVHRNDGTITTNSGLVEQNNGGGLVVTNANGGVITTNSGTSSDQTIGAQAEKGVNENYGKIINNAGYVWNNNGEIVVNTSTGTVYTNSDEVQGTRYKIGRNDGTVSYNYGLIETNTGTVESNRSLISGNYGTIRDGGSNARITDQYAGSVNGTTSITNYFGGTLGSEFNGTVTNNFSDNNVTATNQYRSVSFTAVENGSASYNNAFTEKTLMNSDGTAGNTNYYINVTGGAGTGTITIVAAEGYRVNNTTGEAGGTVTGASNAYGFSYTLVPDGNNCKIEITGYNGNSCTLSADMFHLVLEAIQAVNSDPVTQEIITAEGNTIEETTPAAPQAVNEVTQAVQVQILSALNQTPAGEVANIQFGTDPNFGTAAVQTLFENKSDVEKSCTFTHKGVTYTLIIPPLDPTSPLYKQLLKLLAKEPHGCAGPLRLAQIFAELGVKIAVQ